MNAPAGLSERKAGMRERPTKSALVVNVGVEDPTKVALRGTLAAAVESGDTARVRKLTRLMRKYDVGAAKRARLFRD